MIKYLRFGTLPGTAKNSTSKMWLFRACHWLSKITKLSNYGFEWLEGNMCYLTCLPEPIVTSRGLRMYTPK